MDDPVDTSEVSPSMVLDHLIEGCEKPSVILHFLDGMAEDEQRDTILHSDYAPRLFQLDFLSRCRFSERRHVLVLSRYYGKFQSTYLSWQVLKSNLDDATKTMFRENMNPFERCRHPHAGVSGRVAAFVDTNFLDKDRNIGEIADILNLMPNDRFMSFCVCICHSLFVERILQLDIFSLLSNEKKWILVSKLCSAQDRFERDIGIGYSITVPGIHGCICRFVKQVLQSSVEVDIKCELYDRTWAMCSYPEIDLVPDDIKRKIDEARSYSELEINLVLTGIYEIGVPAVLYMLRRHRISLLIGFEKLHGDFLENHFNIRDIVQELKRRGVGDNDNLI